MADEIEDLRIETDGLRDALLDLSRLGDTFGRTITRAFAGAVVEGRKLSDVLRGLALSLANQTLGAALRPLGNLLGGAITPFARGGVIDGPMLMPLGAGLGLAGEAGPEAILPLARGSDGRLGVRGGGVVNVTVNIAARDVESFRRSQSQVAALVARAAERGARNL